MPGLTLPQVTASNKLAESALPSGLVAVFAGATAGIGSLALRGFAKHTIRPRIYFIGRSEEGAAKLQEELKAINADGEYIFLKANMSLLKETDEVSKQIMDKEKHVNVLFMSQGTANLSDTTEGLPVLTGLTYYSRMRLASNLLPLLRAAPSHRRVISTFAGTKEGKFDITDLPSRKISFLAARGHLTTAMTLALEGLAQRAPEVSFIHNYPGAIKTNLIRPEDGMVMRIVNAAVKVLFRNSWMANEECGERHAFLCLSGIFPAGGGDTREATRALGQRETEKDLVIVRGTNGIVGSGVYSVTEDANAADEKVVALLKGYRDDEYVKKLWDITEEEFMRITGSKSLERTA